MTTPSLAPTKIHLADIQRIPVPAKPYYVARRPDGATIEFWWSGQPNPYADSYQIMTLNGHGPMTEAEAISMLFSMLTELGDAEAQDAHPMSEYRLQCCLPYNNNPARWRFLTQRVYAD